MAHKAFTFGLGGVALLGVATAWLSYAQTRARERHARTTARIRRMRTSTRLRAAQVTPRRSPSGSLQAEHQDGER